MIASRPLQELADARRTPPIARLQSAGLSIARDPSTSLLAIPPPTTISPIYCIDRTIVSLVFNLNYGECVQTVVYSNYRAQRHSVSGSVSLALCKLQNHRQSIESTKRAHKTEKEKTSHLYRRERHHDWDGVVRRRSRPRAGAALSAHAEAAPPAAPPPEGRTEHDEQRASRAACSQRGA